MALHKEEERLCRELDDKHGLLMSLGNQAVILYYRGDLDGRHGPAQGRGAHLPRTRQQGRAVISSAIRR